MAPVNPDRPISRRKVLRNTALTAGVLSVIPTPGGAQQTTQPVTSLPIYRVGQFCGDTTAFDITCPVLWEETISRPSYFYSLSGATLPSSITDDHGPVIPIDDYRFDEPCEDYAWIQFQHDGSTFEGYLGPLWGKDWPQGGFEITGSWVGLYDVRIEEIVDPDGHPFGEFPGILCQPVIEATLDIKPGSDSNAINANKPGVIPVAIIHTDSFDPTEQVAVETLRFGEPSVVENGDGATPAHPDGHFEDVTDDGRDDLVVHFPTSDTGFTGDETVGRLEGETMGGTALFGEDSVRLVGSTSQAKSKR